VSVSSYDAFADWYDQWLGATARVENDASWLAAEALVGDVSGQRICDLACGQGRVAQRLAERGAHVVGIDVSVKMLEIARRHEADAPRGIVYVQADVRSLDHELDGTFDGVVCFMALMDIAHLAPTLRGVARILRPGGWFVFGILHPCYNSPSSGELATSHGWMRTVSRYWDEGFWRSDTRPGPPGKIGAYHRTLSTYLNELADAGFTLQRAIEPRATGSQAERRPVWTEVPAFLFVRCMSAAPSA
jgi:ubiquinone/menaquinone biosynthesis C-methylase UbiE